MVNKTGHDIAVVLSSSTLAMGGLLSMHGEFLPQMRSSLDLIDSYLPSGRFLRDACISCININLTVDVLKAAPRAVELT